MPLIYHNLNCLWPTLFFLNAQMDIPIIQSLRELNTNVARDKGQLRTDERIMCCNVVRIVLINMPAKKYLLVTSSVFVMRHSVFQD